MQTSKRQPPEAPHEGAELARYLGVPIRSDPGIRDGRPIIDGHGVTVAAVVDKVQSGKDVDWIADAYSLSPRKVRAALAYYEDHRDEVDRLIAEDRRFWAEAADRPDSHVTRL